MKKLIFIGVFFSSIVGAQLFGVSLNKIAIMPLEIMLISKTLLKQGSTNLYINKNKKRLILWYIINVLSSILGLIFINNYNVKYIDDFERTELLWIIQICIIYLPILLMLPNNNNILKSDVRESLLLTAKIQALWTLLQFFLYYVYNFDLNEVVFHDILKQASSNWTAYSYIDGKILLRPTGLNHDPAFLGILMIIALIYEKRSLWKLIYLFVIVISLSRSALVTAAALLIYKIISYINNNTLKVKRNLFIRLVAMSLCVLLVFYFLYNKIPSINEQVSRLIARFSTIKTGQDGTSLHLGYFRYSIIVSLFIMPVINTLLGIGMPVSGVGFNIYHNYISKLEIGHRINLAWTIESDFATVLLGTGVIGLVIYYLNLLNFYKEESIVPQNRELIFCILIYGFMYNLAGLTFMQFVFWMFI